MSVNRMFVLLTAALAAVGLPGCADMGPRLDVDVDTCCDADFTRYATYRVSTTNMPGFLEPYLRGGIAPVLAGKGLEPTLDRPDLDVRLSFNQVFLTPETRQHDLFGEGVDPNVATSFMAAVNVDVFDSASERLVWAGRLSRIHYDPHGQPRGNDHKMQGIIDGFSELFADYPVRLVDDNTQYQIN